jgi:hypothetical protein
LVALVGRGGLRLLAVSIVGTLAISLVTIRPATRLPSSSWSPAISSSRTHRSIRRSRPGSSHPSTGSR